MENASKALLIAGSVLLMILVFSLATLIFRRMGSQASEFYKDMSDTEIYEFNQQFFNYERKDLRIQDVISIINLARDANERERVPVEIKVNFLGKPLNLNSDEANIKKMLTDNIDNIETTYECEVKYATKSNYVGEITITKNKT